MFHRSIHNRAPLHRRRATALILLPSERRRDRFPFCPESTQCAIANIVLRSSRRPSALRPAAKRPLLRAPKPLCPRNMCNSTPRTATLPRRRNPGSIRPGTRTGKRPKPASCTNAREYATGIFRRRRIVPKSRTYPGTRPLSPCNCLRNDTGSACRSSARVL